LWPQTLWQEIRQNINTLLTTPKYSVPLGREMGVDAAYVDKPQLAAEAAIRSELFGLIPFYEPRVRVVAIAFVKSEGGDLATLAPRVEVKIL
jgi:phage baseplate assembly protein W